MFLSSLDVRSVCAVSLRREWTNDSAHSREVHPRLQRPRAGREDRRVVDVRPFLILSFFVLCTAITLLFWPDHAAVRLQDDLLQQTVTDISCVVVLGLFRDRCRNLLKRRKKSETAGEEGDSGAEAGDEHARRPGALQRLGERLPALVSSLAGARNGDRAEPPSADGEAPVPPPAPAGRGTLIDRIDEIPEFLRRYEEFLAVEGEVGNGLDAFGELGELCEDAGEDRDGRRGSSDVEDGTGPGEPESDGDGHGDTPDAMSADEAGTRAVPDASDVGSAPLHVPDSRPDGEEDEALPTPAAEPEPCPATPAPDDARDVEERSAPIESLIADLGSEDLDVRERAVRALGARGEEAVDPLIQALGASDDRTRWGVADALREIGEAVVQPLIGALRDPAAQIGAATTLARIGEPAVPRLIAALDDSNGDIQIGAGYALREIGEAAIPALVRALAEPAASLRRKAAEILAELDWQPGSESETIRYLIARERWVDVADLGAPAVEHLIQLIRSPDMTVRRSAARVLVEIGEASVDQLVGLLGEQDTGTQTIAALALGEIGAPAVPSLIEALHVEAARESAAAALAKIGEPAVDALLRLLRDADGEIERIAAYTLAKIGEPATAALIHALTTERSGTRRKIADILEQMGWEPWDDTERARFLIAKEQWMEVSGLGAPAVDPLIHALGDDDEQVRRDAAEALGQIGDPRAVGPLCDLLEVDAVRTDAAEALVRIGAPATAPLIRLLETGSGPVRETAAEVLGRIGSEDAVRPLVHAVQAGDDRLRRRAADALAAIGEASIDILIPVLGGDADAYLGASMALSGMGEAAVQPLIRALRHRDGGVRMGAAEVLDRLGWAPSSEEEQACYLLAKRQWVDLVRLGVPAVAPLVRALGDTDGDVVAGAVEALSRIGAAAVAPLVRALNNAEVRDGAALALERIGGPAVDPLLRALKDENCRELAANVLLAIGEPALLPLIRTLADDDAGPTAAEVLAAMGEAAVEPLIDALGYDSEAVRHRAGSILLKIGSDAIGPLIHALADPDEGIRLGSADVLIRAGKTAVPDLVEAIGDEDYWIRLGAAEVLDRVGWRPGGEAERIRYLIAKEQWAELAQLGAPAVEPLIHALSDPDEDIQMGAAMALGMIGRPAVAHLIHALRGKDAGESRKVIVALQKVGDAAVQALIQALCDGDWQIRLGAARALVTIGEPAVEPLIAALRSSVPAIQMGAAAALGKIGDPRAIEPLVLTLMHEDWHVGRIAVYALGMMGEAAVEPLIRVFREGNETAWKGGVMALSMIGDAAKATLPAVLADDHYRVRAGAAEVLDRLGWSPSGDSESAHYLIAKERWVDLVRMGSPAVEPLIRVLRDRDDAVRRRAAGVLGEIRDPRAVEPLARLMSDEYYSIRREAATALVKIGDPSVGALVQALRDADEDVRRRAATALGEIGGTDAVNALREALGDANWHVRKAVREALDKIQVRQLQSS